MEVKSIVSTEENDFICTNSSDVPPVFGAQNLPENLCCESNIPVEIHSCRGSIRIEQQSGSQLCESLEEYELAADQSRCRTERRQQLEERLTEVSALEFICAEVPLRARVPAAVEADRDDLWTLSDQLAALRRRHELPQNRQRHELDFHISR